MARRIGGAGGGSDPGSGKGVVVAAAVLAGSVAIAGGGVSLGGSATGGAVDAAAGRSVSAKKVESKKSARKGDADEAWRRMGMRTLKKAVKQDLKCLANSFGQVREFFARTPCKSLERMLLGIADDRGNAVVVSVAWVGFHTRSNARDFKQLDDVHGTGNITPLASALLGLADIHFTGLHYQSRAAGNTIVIAEAEPASGQVSDEVLDAIAEVAVLLPRP
ncbi:MAG TPA: hypothetical protein DGT23_33820 [Micromonosporaceae bacterium]|nr:hypothetical protein [Micromonosporaceae bacterium]